MPLKATTFQILSAVLFFCCFAGSSFAKENVITIGYIDVENYPIQMGDGPEVANPPGIAMDIVIQAANDLGYEVELSRYPNNRVQFNLKSGHVDGVCCFSYKIKREQNGQYPEKDGQLNRENRLFEFNYHFFARKDSDVSWDGTNLTNVTTIGANRGYSVVSDLRDLGMTVVESDNTEKNLELLLSGRIQAFALQKLPAEFALSKDQRFQENIVRVDPAISFKDYYLMLSHQFVSENEELAQKIWNRVGEIRDKVIAERMHLYR